MLILKFYLDLTTPIVNLDLPFIKLFEYPLDRIFELRK
jgi:hypothetical protein